MSWKLKKKAQALLAAEQGTVYRDWGGRVSIALVYPNTYAVGMSNLGFQTIYRHLNALPDVVCERVFLPEPADLEEMRRTSTPPQSLESQRPLTDFQLIGFSVTYEGDYVNVLRLLELAGIPLRAADRRAHDPLILMGGVCAFSNPEPIAPFMDFIVVGEGEELVGELMQAYREGYRERETFLDGLVGLEGIYIPERHDVSYAGDGIVADVKPRQAAPAVVSKRRLKQVDAFRTIAAVKTPNAEYGHMALLEVGKGCGRGCRFCLEGQVYRPADGDAPRRGGDSRPRGPDAPAAACAGSHRQAVRQADPVDLIVRAQALDAVPVGGLRRCRVAERQAGDDQARRAHLFQRARAAREPARGGAAGAAGAWRPPRGRLPGAGGAPRGRLAACAARVGRRPRVLHDARAPGRRAPAVGPLRRRREEGGAGPGVGARAGRRAGAGGAGLTDMATAIGDTRGRSLRNLRVSVTDRCNLRCGYCMPEEEYVWLPREEILMFEEISRLVDVFIELGVDKVRLTGGEPLLRRDLPRLITMLAAKPALRDLAITTNGVLLATEAPALRAAGLHRVTVSLDTLRPERFVALTRRSTHAQVLEGIAAVPRAGFTNTKLDTVVIRGVNDDELADLIEFGKRVPAEVRFIEYMDVGGATRWSPDQVMSRPQMLDVLERRYGRIEPVVEISTAPADRFRLPDGTVFGIIASTTAPFCADCDRSRLTADGLWYLCLYAMRGIDLRGPLPGGASNAQLKALVTGGWSARTDRGAEERLAMAGRSPLVQVGGLKRDPHLEMHTRGG